MYESKDRLDLVMECMDGGELFHRVMERKKFSERSAAHAVWQMLLSVNYLHSHGIVHRDLKLENFLYESRESDHLKLIDFGFSKVWEPNTKMALSCGTLAYVAPEVLRKSYTSQCDLWSLGVITFILLVGYMPFAGSEEKQTTSIKRGEYLWKKDSWARISSYAKSFVKELLVVDPKVRLSADKALKHDWILKKEGLHGQEHVDEGIADALTSFAQASQFRRACLSMMAWSLTNDERATVRDAFIEMDTSMKGTIKLGDMKKVLEQKFHFNDTDVAHIFQALDVSHDEEIHYSAFLAAMVSTRIQMHDDLLSATFHRFDVDNTGFITAANLRSVLGESFEGEHVDEMMAEVHADDGKISFDAFMAFMKSDPHDAHTEKAHKVIDTHVMNSMGKYATRKKMTMKQDKDKEAKTEAPPPLNPKNNGKHTPCCAVS